MPVGATEHPSHLCMCGGRLWALSDRDGFYWHSQIPVIGNLYPTVRGICNSPTSWILGAGAHALAGSSECAACVNWGALRWQTLADILIHGFDEYDPAPQNAAAPTVAKPTLPSWLTDLPPAFSETPPKPQYSERVISFGVELETCYPSEAYHRIHDWHAAQPRGGVSGDGSIHPPAGMAGLEPKFWTTDIEEMLKWLKLNYETFRGKPNESCGFHIHTKLPRALEYAPASREYQTSFIKGYKQFAATRKNPERYLDRLRNNFSRVYPWSHAQVVMDLKRHYSGINLGSLRDTQHTVEHRLMPFQETPQEAIEAVLWTLETADRLLQQKKFTLAHYHIDSARVSFDMNSALDTYIQGGYSIPESLRNAKAYKRRPPTEIV